MMVTDLIGPLPCSSTEFSYILVIVYNFSKFVRLFPLRAATGSLITKRIEEHIFLLYGVPQFIICDNEGRVFKLYVKNII